jgi:uroporphyrinogen decarboxylase
MLADAGEPLSMCGIPAPLFRTPQFTLLRKRGKNGGHGVTAAVTLTGKERVDRALEGKDHDRVPLTETVWRDTLQRWEREGGPGSILELYDHIDSDFHKCPWMFIPPLDGGEAVLEENETTRLVRDSYGAVLRQWKHKSGTPEHHGWECDSPEIWREKFRPAWEKKLPAADSSWYLPNNAEATRRGRWRFISVIEPFEYLRKLIGDETTMIHMVEDPEWIVEMSEVSTSVTLRNLDVMLEKGLKLDGLWIYGDMAFNTGPFCSPAMYRDLIWPQHKRMVDWGHANGLKVIFHTDGDVRRVVPDYIDAGFDALQPLEAKASMDVRELCPEYGDQMTFFGNMNIMVYAFGSDEEIRNEIETKMAAGKKTKRYIFHSDHSIPPQVSWERYQMILEIYREMAQY